MFALDTYFEEQTYMRRVAFEIAHQPDSDCSLSTRLLFSGNLIKHPCFDSIRGTDVYRVSGSLKVTDYVMENTFWVGVYPGMTDEMIDYLTSRLRLKINDIIIEPLAELYQTLNNQN